MPCDECRELSTHEFRSADDLIHAIRLAAQEMDRGVLAQVGRQAPGRAEQEALETSLAAGALPGSVRYRFCCTVCGDQFMLVGDTVAGGGGWTRT